MDPRGYLYRKKPRTEAVPAGIFEKGLQLAERKIHRGGRKGKTTRYAKVSKGGRRKEMTKGEIHSVPGAPPSGRALFSAKTLEG